MNKWVEILLGLILVAGTIALVLPKMPLATWGLAALKVLEGGIVWIVILVGLLFLMLGISDLRE